MKCKFCDYPGELEWPENYVKGNLPINVETKIEHDCRSTSDGILRYTCPCGTKIIQFKGERDLCSVCQLEKFKV